MPRSVNPTPRHQPSSSPTPKPPRLVNPAPPHQNPSASTPTPRLLFNPAPPRQQPSAPPLQPRASPASHLLASSQPMSSVHAVSAPTRWSFSHTHTPPLYVFARVAGVAEMVVCSGACRVRDRDGHHTTTDPSTSHSPEKSSPHNACAHSLQPLPPTQRPGFPLPRPRSPSLSPVISPSPSTTTGSQARGSGRLPFSAWQRGSTRSDTSVDMCGQRTSKLIQVGPGRSMPRIVVTQIRFHTTIR